MTRAANMILALAEEDQAAKKKPANMNEIGNRSNDLDVTSDGRLEENEEISLDTYRKMRQDPQVKACLLVLKLPLIQTDFDLHADSDEGKKLGSWARARLYDMDDSMQYYLREILTALDFGRSITEKVWQLKTVQVDPEAEGSSRMEQMIVPLKLKTYDPRSLTFQLNDKMQLVGVVQKQKKGADILIPADKLIIYTHEKEFGDHYGQSVLRAAYKPWIIKEFLQKFWNIALERYGTPFSTMSMPQGASLSSAMALMDQIKHKTGIPLPDGYEMEIHNLANTGMSFKEAIEYQDKMIARAMLIPDTLFGNNDTGSYALSKTHAAFFLLRLNGIGQEIGDILTKYLIKPLVEYNFPQIQELPEFKFNDVADDNLEQLLKIVEAMLRGKVIAPSETWIREKLGLPPADEETLEILEKQRELTLEGMENIQKANAALSGAAAATDPEDPKKKTAEVKVNADPDDKTKAKKKEGVQKNSEDLDDYMENLRSSVRGILKIGISEE